MTQAKQDRTQQALNDLNNQVDQKRLAWENRFLRWLVVFFAVALVLTVIFYPRLPKEEPNHEVEAQPLRDYSDSVSRVSVQFPSEFVVRAVSHTRRDQVSTALVYRF